MINISIKKPKPVLVMVHNASKGLRGVGLSGVTLDKNGNLIFTMSDGTVKTIKGYSQNLINTTNAVNKIKEEVSTMANNAADSAKKAKETADSIKQEYDRVEGATNSGLALIERSVLYGINRVKEATKACKSDALANIELAHKDAIDDIAIRRLEALQDIAGANAAAVSSAAAAKTSETNAETSNQMAKKWAESTESPDGATDSDSSTGNTQSSKSWALHSKSNASAAKVSETNAKTSETNASKSATAAKVSEANAKGSETASAISEANAKTSESNAASSASSASDSEAGAATQASNAAKSATSASSYASSAKTSEANAKLSETHSASSASSASTSASNAKTSETNAKTSETNAGASATTAKNWAVSETSPDGATDTSSGTGKTQSSRTWALESKASAQSASSSANTATTQASSATASAKSASTSATSASDSATSAASSATAAKNSAIAAASSASSASTSATNAKAAMNTANTAASSASTSATNASTSASNASKSEIAAKTAQAAAEKARDDANSAVAKVTGAMKYAGQVDNYSDLSDVTKNTGDVWNIVNADPEHGIKAGDNVAWNGTDWDDLSGTVDLSIYAEKADYQKAITSATANGATITFNHKDGTTSTATVNNVASATAATNDAKGQKIDTTYEKIADASNVHTSLQNSINSLSTGKQDKLTFDTTPITGSSNPVTSGGIKTALDTKLNKTDAANTYLDKLSKTEQVVTAPIKGTLNGNASSATKLANARTINVQDVSASNTGTGASFDGSGNATIKLPAKIKATLTGNADTATKLETARTINIQDATSAHTGTGASFNGTANATIKLPNTIDANITGAIIDKTGFSGYAKLYNSLSPNYVRAGVSNIQNGDNMSHRIWGACISFKYSDFQSGKINSDNGGQLILGNGLQGLWYRSRNEQRLSDTDPEWHDLQRIAYTTSNVASATKLANARTINVQDASASNTGTGASFDGSGNATIKLPAKIKATLTGNADTATKATNDGNGNPIASTYLPLSGGTLTGVVNGVTPPNGDNSKKLATTEFVTATAQQADWNVTDTTSKAFVKNKPINLVNIGNSPKFNLINFYKDDNRGNPVYFLMHELVQYNPDKLTLPISAVYGFNGMVFGQPRVGNVDRQFLAMVKVGLGYAYNDLYSSSGNYSPVVIKDETNNKYYWAMEIKGSYQNVYMLGVFTANPLNTVISAVDRAGTLPEGWSLVHTAKLYPFDNTHVASANMDKLGNPIDTTYLKKSDAATSLTTNTLTATDATFTGQTSVPTANAGNSSKAIANTAYVQGELTNYLPLSGGTLTGVVNGVTPPNGDNSTKIATTAFVNAKAGNYLSLSGGTMTGDINMAKHNIIGGTSTNTGIYCAGNDNGGTLGTTGSNINIKSWYGVGFINGCPDSPTYYNQVTVGIDVRKGTLSAHNLVATESIKAPNIYTKTEVDNEFSKKAETYTKTEVDNEFSKKAETYTKTEVDNKIATDGLPTGTVLAFAGNTVPNNYLLCDGSAVSRSTYANLFKVIGTTYGAGDGSTTFNLPNLVDRFVEGGSASGAVKNAGLPNITGSTAWAVNGTLGTFSTQDTPYHQNTGALSVETDGKAFGVIGSKGDDSQNSNVSVNINASLSNPIYGASDTVQPPALIMRYIIKH